MAALILLLVALSYDRVHAETIQMEGASHRFALNTTADFCLISRWVGEEKILLWNSSQHLDAGPREKASYKLSDLNVLSSGPYQVQCWTQNNVTHERNSTLLVCDKQKARYSKYFPYNGQTLELTCTGPNQSVQWCLFGLNEKTQNYECTLIDDETYSVYEQQLVKNKSSLLVTFHKSSYGVNYICLEKNHQGCEVLSSYDIDVQPKRLFSSVGESLELNCSDISENEAHKWEISNLEMEEEDIYNHTLVFPSLTLDHTGNYFCFPTGKEFTYYFLCVCPESDPPAFVFFTGGENVTLQCGDETDGHVQWYMRTNGTEGRESRVKNLPPTDRIHVSGTSLGITNISLEHSGEFWCVVYKGQHCAFTAKTLVMFGEPEVDHHLARSLLLCVALMMLLGFVVVVIWRTRSREQLPVPVEEVEMSDLSADVRSETL